MPRVLLLHPWCAELFPPPAIGYLRAALERHGVTVVSAYLDTYPAGPFDFVGVSLHSFSVKHMPLLIPHLRKTYPGAKLVAGGHHATALPKETLAYGFDEVLTGPGELALLDLVLGGKHTDGAEPTIPNYADLDQGWGMPMGQPGRGIGILSSVGCPFKCSFCASTNFWGGHWYPLTPEQTMHVLEAQIVRYKLDGWMFEDDNFTLQSERAMQICERIGQSAVAKGKPWHAASRAESLCSEPLCKALKSAGCTHVWLGVESLCQETLDRCCKSTKVEAVVNGIMTAKRAGLQTVCQFIVGLPGETEQSMSKTIDSCRTMNIKAAVNKAWVLPGTEIHRKALEYGFSNQQYLQGVPLYEYEWPAGTLHRWASILERT